MPTAVSSQTLDATGEQDTRTVRSDMRLPRLRFKVKRIMTAIVLVCLLMAFMIQRHRFRILKRELIDQELRVEGAYVNYLNAELAHDNARFDAALYLENKGKGWGSVNK